MRACSPHLLFTLAVAVLTATLSYCSSGRRGSPGIELHRPDFTGTWLLNHLESDDPAALFAGPGQVDPSLPGGNRRRVGEAVSNILATARAFKIEQDDSTFAITLANRRQFAFHHDGRWVERHVEGLGVVVARARWKGEELEVERRLDSRVRLITTYVLSDDGRQLFVKFKKTPPGRIIKFERVYDAAQG